jgi:hypothetical protein
MKKYILIFMAVLVLGLPVGVRAETSDVVVPDVESRWFGVSWAVEKVKHNFSVWVARTDEKKTELDLKFAEKEEKLAGKIAKLEETNPKAAERLGKVAEKLKQKRIERMERIESRIEKMGEKGEVFEQRLMEKKERFESFNVGRRNHVDEDGEDDDHDEDDEDEDSGQTIQGKGVKIQNAKPGVVRMR